MKKIYLTLICCIYALSCLSEELVGKMNGALSVNPLGAAIYTIPIEIQDGGSSFKPDLSLTYNSQAGNGVAGYGWSISGLSTISIAPKSVYYDGAPQGLVDGEDNAYLLNGMRLLLVSGTNGQVGARYRLEEEDYSIIEITSSLSSTPGTFVVKTVDGTRYFYGSRTGRSYYRNGDAVYQWHLDYAVDRLGNYIEYQYVHDGIASYLNRIIYGKNENTTSGTTMRVDFNYETRSDEIPLCIHRQTGSISKRLSSVVCRGVMPYYTYSMEYQTNVYSYLSSVTQSGVGGSRFRPTTFTWSHLPGLSVTSSSRTVPTPTGKRISDLFFTSGDIDNDGRSELVTMHFSDGSTPQYNAELLKKNGLGGFSLGQCYSTQNVIGVPGTPFDRSVAGNFIGYFCRNSSLSLLVPCFENNDGTYEMRFHFMNAGRPSTWTLRSQVNKSPLHTYCDVNNDGVTDVVIVEKGKVDGRYTCGILHPRVSSGNLSEEEFSIQLAREPQKILMLDVDADGMEDLLVTTSGGYYVFYNRNGSFSDESSYHSTDFSECDILESGDFNGDGLIDIVLKAKGSTTWKLALNDATSTGLYTLYDITPLTSNGVGQRCNEGELYCLVQDFDCDGKSDILVGYSSRTSRRFVSGNLLMLRSNGLQFHEEWATAFSTEQTFPTLSRIVQGDFDGDGYAEVLYYAGDASSTTPDTSGWRELSIDGFFPATGRLVSVTDGMGATDSIFYDVTATPSVYTSDTTYTYPLFNFNTPLPVVARLTRTGSTATEQSTFQYKNCVAHLPGKGVLGFGEVTTSSSNEQITTIHNRLNDDFNALYPEWTRTVSSLDGTVLKSQNQRIIFERISDRSFFMHPETPNSTRFPGYVENCSLTNWEYGAPRNRTLENNIYKKSEEWTMWDGYNEGLWIKNLPSEIATTKISNQDGGLIEQSESYTRDPGNGNVLKCITEVDGETLGTDMYEYDVFGKVTKRSTIYGNSSDTLVTLYTYGTNGKLLSKTDPMGRTESFQYDLYGRMTRKTDAFGVTTSYSYDGMHRCLAEQNSVSPTETAYLSSSYPGAAYMVMKREQGGPWHEIHYDEWDRKVAEGETRFDGRVLYKDYSYLPNGLLGFESAPHFGTGVTETGITYTYDNQQRLVSSTDENGKSTTITYNNQEVTTTVDGVSRTEWYALPDLKLTYVDENGEISYHTRPDGQMGWIENSETGENTEFSYDALGRLTSTTDMNGQTRNFTYDDNGYQHTKSILNGVLTTTYDKFGNLLESTVTELGRIVQTCTYQYNDKFQVVSESSDMHEYGYIYDNYGRLSQKTIHIDSLAFSPEFSYTYDSFGRVATKSAKLLSADVTDALERYVYQNGWVTEIYLNDTLVWRLSEEDDMGRPSLVEDFLNENAVSYDRYGRLLQSSLQGHNTLSQTFTYNLQTGNMSSKNGVSYTYDSQNRLTGEGNVTYTYDGNNNLSRISNVGNFTFNGYRATSITQLQSGICPESAINIRYSHAMERPLAINSLQNHGTLWYDGAGNRIRMDIVPNIGSYNEQRFYVSDCCEIVYKNRKKILYYYAGGTPYNAKAVLKKTSDCARIYQMYRDNIGSIILYASQDESVALGYNAWGVRKTTATGSALVCYGTEDNCGFIHTYTGHEYLAVFGLYNANARLYSPYFGRFLTPDPVLNTKGGILDYNPYVYCMNNPFKYVDETGELFGSVAIFTTFINTIVNVVKHGFNVSQYNWSRTRHSWKIEAAPWKGNWKQVIGNWTWSLPNTFVGNILGHFYNSFHSIDGVSTEDGLTAIGGALKRTSAATIGPYSIGPENYTATWKDHLFVHEYGHYMQSQRWGLFFTIGISFASLHSAKNAARNFNPNLHKYKIWETNASHLGAMHFHRKSQYDEDCQFDINYFRNGKNTPYINPRYGTRKQYDEREDKEGEFKGYPTSKMKKYFY